MQSRTHLKQHPEVLNVEHNIKNAGVPKSSYTEQHTESVYIECSSPESVLYNTTLIVADSCPLFKIKNCKG